MSLMTMRFDLKSRLKKWCIVCRVESTLFNVIVCDCKLQFVIKVRHTFHAMFFMFFYNLGFVLV